MTRDSAAAARDVLAALDGKLFATVPEAAVVLRSDERSVRRAIAAGNIPAQPRRAAQARARRLAAPGRGAGNERGRSLGPASLVTHVHGQENGARRAKHRHRLITRDITACRST